MFDEHVKAWKEWKRKEYSKRWWQSNKEKAKEYRQRPEAKERSKEYSKRYYKINKEKRKSSTAKLTDFRPCDKSTDTFFQKRGGGNKR